MKFLKITGLVLIIIIVAITVISFFLPGDVHVERSIAINASPKTVFSEVNDLKNWPHWSPWHQKDTAMLIDLSDQTKGIGAIFRWESESHGNGKLTIIESIPFEHIKNQLEFAQHEGVSYGIWKFEKTDEGTFVTWAYEGGLPFALRIMGLFLDNMLGKDYDQGLDNLKMYCENINETIKENPEISIVELSEMPMYFIKDSTDMASISEKFNIIYREVMEHIQRSNVSVTGAALSIWHSWNKDGISHFSAGFPVSETKEGSGRVTPGKTPSGKFVAMSHNGSYDNFEITHNAIQQYIDANNLTINGPVMEVYLAGPGTEQDTTKWITQIYYSVGE